VNFNEILPLLVPPTKLTFLNYSKDSREYTTSNNVQISKQINKVFFKVLVSVLSLIKVANSLKSWYCRIKDSTGTKTLKNGLVKIFLDYIAH